VFITVQGGTHGLRNKEQSALEQVLSFFFTKFKKFIDFSKI